MKLILLLALLTFIVTLAYCIPIENGHRKEPSDISSDKTKPSEGTTEESPSTLHRRSTHLRRLVRMSTFDDSKPIEGLRHINIQPLNKQGNHEQPSRCCSEVGEANFMKDRPKHQESESGTLEESLDVEMKTAEEDRDPLRKRHVAEIETTDLPETTVGLEGLEYIESATNKETIGETTADDGVTATDVTLQKRESNKRIELASEEGPAIETKREKRADNSESSEIIEIEINGEKVTPQEDLFRGDVHRSKRAMSITELKEHLIHRSGQDFVELKSTERFKKNLRSGRAQVEPKHPFLEHKHAEEINNCQTKDGLRNHKNCTRGTEEKLKVKRQVNKDEKTVGETVVTEKPSSANTTWTKANNKKSCKHHTTQGIRVNRQVEATTQVEVENVLTDVIRHEPSVDDDQERTTTVQEDTAAGLQEDLIISTLIQREELEKLNKDYGRHGRDHGLSAADVDAIVKEASIAPSSAQEPSLHERNLRSGHAHLSAGHYTHRGKLESPSLHTDEETTDHQAHPVHQLYREALIHRKFTPVLHSSPSPLLMNTPSQSGSYTPYCTGEHKVIVHDPIHCPILTCEDYDVIQFDWMYCVYGPQSQLIVIDTEEIPMSDELIAKHPSLLCICDMGFVMNRMGGCVRRFECKEPTKRW